MRIDRIEQIMEMCEEHLSSLSAYGTEIESLLTQAILVIMYSEFEKKIKGLVQKKCSSIEDSSIKEFFGSCVNAMFRSIKSTEMAGLLNRFGPSHKGAFQQKTHDHQRAETFYNNIVTNRHWVAHSEGSQATFREAKQFYEEGHVVLDFFQQALLERDSA